MDGDWQPRGHPLHRATLPSVAELLASSQPSASSVPAYHQQHHHPPLPALTTSAHASQASPTESATSTSITPRCQDSAIAPHRVQTPKDRVSSAPPMDADFAHAQQSPNDHYRATSPASIPHPSPHTSPASSHHHSAPVAASHENAQSRPGPDSAPRGASALQPDHSNITNPRQQRYNVRFAANHTPASMPLAQKSRQSPPLPPPPAQPEVAPSPPRTPDDAVVLSDEPAIQAIQRSLHRSEEQQQPEPRSRELKVERCLGCNETWSRPLFNPSSLESTSLAKSANEMDKATSGFINIVEQLQLHTKDADANYAQWIAHHGKCPRNTKSSSPSPSLPLHPTPATASNDPSHSDGQTHTNSNKRKSEALHSDTQKLRKVTFDAESPPAQFVRPSATT